MAFLVEFLLQPYPCSMFLSIPQDEIWVSLYALQLTLINLRFTLPPQIESSCKNPLGVGWCERYLNTGQQQISSS